MNINDISLKPFKYKGKTYRVTSVTKSKIHKWINGEMRFKWKVGVLNTKIKNAKIEYWYFGYDNIKY